MREPRNPRLWDRLLPFDRTTRRPNQDREAAESREREPLLIDIKGLERMLGRDVRSLERDECAGRLPRPIRLGRSKRWRVAEIRAWVEPGCPELTLWEAMSKPSRVARAG